MEPLRVGDVLHGFCGGAFGRDHYYCSSVEAIGSDWVVVREIDTLSRSLGFATGKPERLTEYRDADDCTRCNPSDYPD
jgi:hypothetical protein